MKRTAALLACLLLLAVCLTAGGCRRSPAPSSLVILGDSIATGYGLPDGSESFGARLKKAFALGDSDYRNLAVNGADSGDLLQLLSGRPAAVKSADVIVVSVGGNDLLGPFIADLSAALRLSGISPDDAAQALARQPELAKQLAAYWEDAQVQARYTGHVSAFAGNFKNAMAELRRLNPRARVYVFTVYDPLDGTEGYDSLTSFAKAMIGRINAVIRSDSGAGGYKVLDLYGAFAGKSAALTDILRLDVHPSQAGHEVIFRTVYKAIMGREYDSSSR